MKKLLFLAALTLCAAPAYAAPDRFEQMDKDGNGQVDWEEFQAAVPPSTRSTPTRAAASAAANGTTS